MNIDKKYCFVPDLYQPLIIGDVRELADHIEQLAPTHPRVSEVFLKVFKENDNRSFVLEDWLIVIPYQFIWNNKGEALSWFENLFHEVANHDLKLWNDWINEIAKKVKTSHELCDKIYSALVQLYAIVFLIRGGFSCIAIPQEATGKNNQKKRIVDVVAEKNNQKYAVECKFIKTSKKFQSLFWRIDRAMRDCSTDEFFRKFFSKKLLFNVDFRFPASKDIQDLSPTMCRAMKFFTKEVYLDPLCNHEMSFEENGKNMIFTYIASFGVPESSEKMTKERIDSLIDTFLRVLERAKIQLNDDKYEQYQKIAFIGTQLDPIFFMNGNYELIEEVKFLIARKMQKEHSIKIIFSEDVGFSAWHYL